MIKATRYREEVHFSSEFVQRVYICRLFLVRSIFDPRVSRVFSTKGSWHGNCHTICGVLSEGSCALAEVQGWNVTGGGRIGVTATSGSS